MVSKKKAKTSANIYLSKTKIAQFVCRPEAERTERAWRLGCLLLRHSSTLFLWPSYPFQGLSSPCCISSFLELCVKKRWRCAHIRPKTWHSIPCTLVVCLRFSLGVRMCSCPFVCLSQASPHPINHQQFQAEKCLELFIELFFPVLSVL